MITLSLLLLSFYVYAIYKSKNGKKWRDFDPQNSPGWFLVVLIITGVIVVPTVIIMFAELIGLIIKYLP